MLSGLKTFFSLGHLFNLRPQALSYQSVTVLIIVFAIFIAGAIGSKIIAKKTEVLKAKGWAKLAHWFLTMGIIGYVYLFFAWQGAALLSARFWLIIWFLVAIIWVIFILKYLLVEAPKKRQEIDQKRRLQKYIP